MKIFVDTAELDEIREAYSWGIVDGVTTNPSLIKNAVQSRDHIDMEEYIGQICAAVDGPVSLEVISVTAEEMVREAILLYDRFNEVNGNVVIKIPVNPRSDTSQADRYEGLKALTELAERGIPTNTTLVMKPEQALLAAKAGTQYVSPFAGRIDDFIRAKTGLQRGQDYEKGAYHDSYRLHEGNRMKLRSRYSELSDRALSELYLDEEIQELQSQVQDEGITDGVHLVDSICTIFRNYNFDTQVLAASLRNPRQVREVAEAGADVATIPFGVLEGMLDHYKTREGIDSFTEDVVPEYRALFE